MYFSWVKKKKIKKVPTEKARFPIPTNCKIHSSRISGLKKKIGKENKNKWGI